MWIEIETKGSLDKKMEEVQAGHLSLSNSFGVIYGCREAELVCYKYKTVPVIQSTSHSKWCCQKYTSREKNTPLIVTVTDVLQKCTSLYIHTSWHCDFAAPPIKKWSLHMTLIYYCVSYTSIEKKKREILSPAKWNVYRWWNYISQVWFKMTQGKEE